MKNALFSPPVVVSQFQTDARTVHIVREDLLPGGTKQRAIVPFLEELIAAGYSEFVYASPFCGFAQVALAYAAGILEQKTKVFAERAPLKKGKFELHEFSLHAESLGANVTISESLADAENKAAQYVACRPQAYLIPLGFNHPSFLAYYSVALEEQFSLLKKALGSAPQVIWLPVGSGTLTRVFRAVLPAEVQLKCVNVHVLARTDQRITTVTGMKGVEMYNADLPFHKRCEEETPVPSNAFYDAKIWSFVKDRAQNGDVWWNVAR